MDTLAEATNSSIHHLNVILLLGIAIFGGTVGARIFRLLRIPQIIGCIIIGVVIGESGLRLISEDVVRVVEPLNYFALGIIGFMIGGELKLDILKKYGKQFVAILIAEGVSAFLLVTLAVCLICYAFTSNIKMSIATRRRPRRHLIGDRSGLDDSGSLGVQDERRIDHRRHCHRRA